MLNGLFYFKDYFFTNHSSLVKLMIILASKISSYTVSFILGIIYTIPGTLDTLRLIPSHTCLPGSPISPFCPGIPMRPTHIGSFVIIISTGF